MSAGPSRKTSHFHGVERSSNQLLLTKTSSLSPSSITSLTVTFLAVGQPPLGAFIIINTYHALHKYCQPQTQFPSNLLGMSCQLICHKILSPTGIKRKTCYCCESMNKKSSDSLTGLNGFCTFSNNNVWKAEPLCTT